MTLLAGLLAALLLPAAGASADAALPTYTYRGEVTVAEDLEYNPTGEFIFPSVFHAGARLQNPLGEWYLYYAPHEDPGGISFLYADSLDGPWTEYEDNPVVANVWPPHYSVPHVSSPDVVWNAQEQKVFLYFHGDNGTTRYATSDDGAHFTYGGVAVTNEMGGDDITESSYARVVEHPDPASRFAYAMVYMNNTTADVRQLRVAESIDGRTWHVRATPLLTPVAGETNVSGGNLYTHDGELYLLYHASDGVIYARPIDPALTAVGERRVFHRSSGEGEDTGRVAAPEIVDVEDTSYLFYESGDRLSATIRYASGPV